jgi:hypothetical protein
MGGAKHKGQVKYKYKYKYKDKYKYKYKYKYKDKEGKGKKRVAYLYSNFTLRLDDWSRSCRYLCVFVNAYLNMFCHYLLFPLPHLRGV